MLMPQARRVADRFTADDPGKAVTNGHATGSHGQFRTIMIACLCATM
jgi:hypothetical protein